MLEQRPLNRLMLGEAGAFDLALLPRCDALRLSDRASQDRIVDQVVTEPLGRPHLALEQHFNSPSQFRSSRPKGGSSVCISPRCPGTAAVTLSASTVPHTVGDRWQQRRI